MKKTFYSFLVLLIFSISCQDRSTIERKEIKRPDISLKVFTDKTKIELGDDFHYTIEVVAKKNLIVELPDFGSHLQKEFAIRDLQNPIAEDLGNYTKQQQIYTINCYSLGNLTIAPAIIRYAPKKENKGKTEKEETNEETNPQYKELASSEIFIEIISPLKLDKDGEPIESTEDIEELEPVLSLEAPKKDYTKLVAGILGGVFILILLLYLVLKPSNKIEATPPPPAHYIALKELERIKSLELIAKEEFKEYYNLVSFCLRTYLENRFELKAPERTTQEFVAEMVQTDSLTEDQKSQLREFLTHCDLVKFAKNIPTASQCESIFETVEEFIQSTKKQEDDFEEDDEEDEEEEIDNDVDKAMEKENKMEEVQ